MRCFGLRLRLDTTMPSNAASQGYLASATLKLPRVKLVNPRILIVSTEFGHEALGAWK